MNLLRVESVSKRYGSNWVLRDVSMHLHPGEFVVLIGGSGSGKTTLLRLIAGLAQADDGTIALREELVDDSRSGRFVPAERRHLGMVFQDYALWPHLSCIDNVMAAARGSSRERQARALELLDRVGIANLAGMRPHQLSGGQQQRVGVARALASEPDLLLFDEALSSLDADIRDQLRLEIRKLAYDSGAAALFVSHDPLDAWRLADRVAVLEEGVLTQIDTPAALYAHPRTARVARFIGASGGFLSRIESEGGQCGIRLDGSFLPAPKSQVAPGSDGLVYVRTEGVRRTEAGIPAELRFCTFESGQYRAYWRVPGTGGSLCSHEAAPPPNTARLTITPEHILVYPPSSGSCA